MAPDDPGVLGNLPRSRPGTRSAKRQGSASGPSASKATSKTGESAPDHPDEPDGISAAVRGAGQMAEAALGAASRAAGGLVGRLTRR